MCLSKSTAHGSSRWRCRHLKCPHEGISTCMRRVVPLLMATAIFAPPWVRVTLPAQTGPKTEAFDYEGIKDGQLFHTDGATLEALYTPGHTEDHVSFLLREEQVRYRFTLVSYNVA